METKVRTDRWADGHKISLDLKFMIMCGNKNSIFFRKIDFDL